MKSFLRTFFSFLLALIVLCSSAIADIEVRFFDVGDADAALVLCDGHAMLVDGGNKSDSSRMYSILKQSGISHLDIVVASHAHADHIGGIPGALNYATADLILCPVKSYTESSAFADFEKYANKNGNGITIPIVGSSYSLGGADIEILGVNSASGVNDSSIIMKVTYGQVSFLFTGDAESAAEWEVVSSGVDLSSTVLKVAHHGSGTSTTTAFLKKVKPSFAVISVSIESTYGFPVDTVLKKLQDYGAAIYRTDQHGDITFTSDGQEISVSVETNRPINTKDDSSFEVADNVTYIVNTNTKKFHAPECRHAKTIKEKNRKEHTGTREELIEKGYQPCKNCNP